MEIRKLIGECASEFANHDWSNIAVPGDGHAPMGTNSTDEACQVKTVLKAVSAEL